MSFPENFAWGAATAAYQVEGAESADGKGLSIWNTYEKEPGHVFRGHCLSTACDHYHRYREDVALMRALGLRAYRLSVSWPRVLPTGTGPVNAAGLDFYDRLIDELMAAGIAPYLTLFHWDLPEELQCRGHWLNRDSADWFADYAKVVVDRLGDRVGHWLTINEPTIHLLYGYRDGTMAPGLRLPFRDTLRQLHHLLLAHGRAVQVIRAAARRPPLVGWTHACAPSIPASADPADLEAARQATFDMPAVPETEALHASGWWNDPVYLGHYPAASRRAWAADLPAIRDGDMALIHQELDFCGLNIYHSHRVRAGAHGPERIPWPQNMAYTTMSWPMTPAALYWGPRFFHERYGKPIYIFENGISCTDCVSLDGKIHDPTRCDYVARYLQEFARAGRDGVDIRGYFLWALMDVHEWNGGYRDRFGLIHVDRETMVRSPKDSFYWYRDVIAGNGASLGSV